MNQHAMDFGEGSPIVFLHGWGQNLNMMMPIAKSLSTKYRCFVPIYLALVEVMN